MIVVGAIEFYWRTIAIRFHPIFFFVLPSSVNLRAWHFLCCSKSYVMWNCIMRRVYYYFFDIKISKMVLWCYLIWYFVTLYYHFDSSPKLWINSLGISVVIGTALMLSVNSNGSQQHWQTFRLYWMPFAVSSFAALIKDQGYFVIFSKDWHEVVVAVGSCGAFLLMVYCVKWSFTKKDLLQ